MLRLHPAFRFLRALHRWLSLIIGLQVLVWVGTGLIMSLIDQTQAGGFTTRAVKDPRSIEAGSVGLMPPEKLVLGDSIPLGLRLTVLGDLPVYQIETRDGFRLFDARSGRAVVIDSVLAQSLALASYSGQAAPDAPLLLLQGVSGIHPIEGPVWEVPLADRLATRVYVHGETGAVLAHRNARGELMEILLMLHFMDYWQRGGFNNLQIIITAILTLWLVISGVLLLCVSFTPFRRRVGREA
jgi:uncharacterized iron-regulated membrane protein